jgi:hypothetical protein
VTTHQQHHQTIGGYGKGDVKWNKMSAMARILFKLGKANGKDMSTRWFIYGT